VSDKLPHENHELHKKWRQGDFALASGPFLFADLPDESGDLMAAVFDDPDPAGLVVISQTCDIVSTTDKLPTVVVCPLVAVKPEHLDMIARGRSARFGFIEQAPQGLVADFGRLMSISKALLSNWKRFEGFIDETGLINFARGLERAYGRFAFPDAFNESIRPLEDVIKSKFWKDGSPLGKALRSLAELRVRPSTAWASSPIGITFFLIFDAAEKRVAEPEAIHAEFESALKGLPWIAPFFLADPGIRIGSYDDFSARDYIESVPLDLNALSFAARNTQKA
jgi:hypothetical protein